MKRARVYDLYARIYAPIFMKIFFVVSLCPMNLSLFRKDPSFSWGDISLFVTLYNLELKISSFSNLPKNAILSSKKCNLRFIFFKFFYDNNIKKPFVG